MTSFKYRGPGGLRLVFWCHLSKSGKEVLGPISNQLQGIHPHDWCDSTTEPYCLEPRPLNPKESGLQDLKVSKPCDLNKNHVFVLHFLGLWGSRGRKPPPKPFIQYPSERRRGPCARSGRATEAPKQRPVLAKVGESWSCDPSQSPM